MCLDLCMKGVTYVLTLVWLRAVHARNRPSILSHLQRSLNYLLYYALKDVV